MSNDLPSVGTEDARRLADEIEPLTRKCRPDNLTQGVAARALRLLAAERDELAGRVGELEGDAARYQFIRSGGVYIEPNEGEIYMATDTGKYYTDMRDFDMDIDAALNASKEQP